MDQLRAIFKKLDLDGDGKITPKEIIALAQKAGLKPVESLINESFQIINLTGKLEIPEPLFLFKLQCRIMCPQCEKDLKKIFKVVDSNKDGYIQFEELWTLMEKFNLHTLEEAKAIFDKFDTNKDSKLDLPEFKSMLKASPQAYGISQALVMFFKRCPFMEAFRRIDTNGDGKILPEELKVLGDKLGLNHPLQKYSEYLSVINPLHVPEVDAALFVHLMKERMADKSKLKEMKRFFKFLDKSGDGLLDADEILSFVTALGLKFTKEKITEGIKAFDLNNDGKIEPKEFAEFVGVHDNVRIGIHALLLLTQDCPYKRAFDYFDNNHDGSISPDEIVVISKKLKNEWSLEKATKCLSILNPTGKAEITEDLFYSILKMRMECPCAEKELLEAFKFIDTDNNGFITPKEMVEFVTNLLGERVIPYEKIISEIYKFDTNGDLKISLCEFMTLVNSNLRAKIAFQTILMFLTAENKSCCK
jgi:Ca2+-binding EF-hand superfamily protein